MVHCQAMLARVPDAAGGLEFTRHGNSAAAGELGIFIARRVGSRLRITSG